MLVIPSRIPTDPSPNPNPNPNQEPHGIRFSNTKKYLACTTIAKQGDISIYALDQAADAITTSCVTSLKNKLFPLTPKSVAFTKDDAYMVVVYATRANPFTRNKSQGFIVSYAFNSATGTINSKPVSVYRNNEVFCGADDINFSIDDSSILLTEQAKDQIVVISFNKETVS